MKMNAGTIQAKHCTEDNTEGGGRLIEVTEDKVSITLGFEDGSFGTVMYLGNSAASFPKEQIDVFAAGRVFQLDNFRSMKGYGWPEFKKINLWKQDKEQNGCVAAFLRSIELGEAISIPHEKIFEVASVSLEVAELLRKH